MKIAKVFFLKIYRLPGETINYAQQAINWRERLETERDHLMHSSTVMGEYSSRLQQLGNLEQQINQSNMLVQSLSARAELLSNRSRNIKNK